MIKNNLHLVQKQFIDIAFPGTNAVLYWEQNHRGGFIARLNEQIEKCFDEQNIPGKHLIIDRMEIDLGILTEETMQAEAPARLYTEIQKKIRSHLDQILQEEPFEPGNKSGVNKTGGDFDVGEYALLNPHQGKLKTMFFFLEKGYLPWWGKSMAEWDVRWMQGLSNDEIGDLRNFLVSASARALRRLTVQFQDDFIHHLLQRLGIFERTKTAWHWLKGSLEEQLQKANDKTMMTGSEMFSIPQIRSVYWSAWLLYALKQTALPKLSDVLRAQPELFSMIKSQFLKPHSVEINRTLFKRVPDFWQKEFTKFKKEEPENGSEMENMDLPHGTGPATDRSTIQQYGDSDLNEVITSEQALFYDQSLSKVKNKDIQQEQSDSIFIENAGLVLLHPFLQQLFLHCGWITKKGFTSDQHKTMAVYALHYLATGEAEAGEHKLVFPKLLAGLAADVPLEPAEPLPVDGKNACDQLLLDVLSHWEPLHNTSVGGLREAFLQRPGKIEHTFSGWHLTIERKTLDVLLKRLPWGISLIKLPWMPEIITVTWQ